jgi:release factor glutamine methyltransferase
MKNNNLELLSTASVQQIIRKSKLDSLDTRLLLAHILNCTKEKLITNADYELSENEYQQFIHDYVKRLAGMPLSYILGYKEFYSRLFKVTVDTLIPRPETEFLVDLVLKLCKEQTQFKISDGLQHKRVIDESLDFKNESILPPRDIQQNLSLLELGTGTGCIAISCKLENPCLQVTATDNYPATLEVAISNAKTYDADIKFIQSDWYSDITDQFDIIVSNPPYIEADDEHLINLTYEPQYALTDFADGLSCIRQIVSDAPTYLKNRGYLILEHGYNQGEQVRLILSNQGFNDVRTILDYASQERVTFGWYCNSLGLQESNGI